MSLDLNGALGFFFKLCCPIDFLFLFFLGGVIDSVSGISSKAFRLLVGSAPPTSWADLITWVLVASSISEQASTVTFALVARCRVVAGVRLDESVGKIFVDFGVLRMDREDSTSG